jgi:cytochrome c oxidase subunit II
MEGMNGPNRLMGRVGVWGAVIVLATLAAACAPHAAQDYLKPAGQPARDEANLWNLVFWVAVGIFILVEGLILFALIRYRYRPGRAARQFHGNPKLEVVLTVIPALLLAGVAVPTLRTIFAVASTPTGPNVVKVTVTAHQFWWEFDYPDYDIATANELHIPTHAQVYAMLRGVDVIHSFWIPKLTGKQDVVPGHINRVHFDAPDPGTYLGQCTEYCGFSHANMRLRAVAQTPAAFRAWVAREKQPASIPRTGLAARGAKLFVNGSGNGTFPGGPACVNCHAVQGLENAGRRPGLIGPDLTHFESRSTFAGATFHNNTPNLRTWLADSPAMKPGVDMPDLGLSPGQIRALIAFLQSLK